MFVIALPAEFVANDKPILVQYRGELYMPIFQLLSRDGVRRDFPTEAIYRDPEVECLIVSGGLDACFDDPRASSPMRRTGGRMAADRGGLDALAAHPLQL